MPCPGVPPSPLLPLCLPDFAALYPLTAGRELVHGVDGADRPGLGDPHMLTALVVTRYSLIHLRIHTHRRGAQREHECEAEPAVVL